MFGGVLGVFEGALGVFEGVFEGVLRVFGFWYQLLALKCIKYLWLLISLIFSFI